MATTFIWLIIQTRAISLIDHNISLACVMLWLAARAANVVNKVVGVFGIHQSPSQHYQINYFTFPPQIFIT